MSVVNSAVQWAINTANDNSHGYSQAARWGNPDYDCSSFVISAYEQAGVPVKRAGASYTGNMRGAFITCGFVDVTGQCNLGSGAGIQAGDVLLNYAAHTCIAIGGGRVANCRTDEGHPQGGDQSGNEIRLQSYWNYPWNCVLRYVGGASSNAGSSSGSNSGSTSAAPQVTAGQTSSERVLRFGTSGEDVKELQEQLLKLGYDLGRWGADGSFGNDTRTAVKKFQLDHLLTPIDGEVGPATRQALKLALEGSESEAPKTDTTIPYQKIKVRTIKMEDEGSDVKLAQAALQCWGYTIVVTGIFGKEMDDKVRKFQTAKGLTVDGEIGPNTWKKLLEV